MVLTGGMPPVYYTYHVFIRKQSLDTSEFPIRKSAISGKLKEIEEFRGDVCIVRRTRNPAD